MNSLRNTTIIFLMVIFVLFAANSAFAQTDTEFRKMAEPIIDNILNGIKSGDYAKYSRDFDKQMKDSTTEEDFKKLRSSLENFYGQYESRTFSVIQTHEDKSKDLLMKKIIWKGKYSKSNTGVSIQLVFKKYGKNWKVTGLWFNPWTN